MLKDAKCMLTLPLRRFRSLLKGKQCAGTGFHNLAIYRKLLATSVPQYVLQMFTSQKDKLWTGVEKLCTCIWHTKFFSIITLKKNKAKTVTFLSFQCEVYKRIVHMHILVTLYTCI